MKKSTYEILCQRLGQLDKERREVLKELKSSPEFITKYLNDTLTSFAKEGKWFSRKNEKDIFAYFRLNSFAILPKDVKPTSLYTRRIPKKDQPKPDLIRVTLTWDHYDYNATQLKTTSEQIEISAFNEIERQILAGRIHTTNFSEKTIQKTILAAKKKELEEQLKKLKLQMAAI